MTKKHKSELYDGILAHVERHKIFTVQHAFADMKTGRRVIDKISADSIQQVI